MFPSPQNLGHDRRWVTSSRTASLATLCLNVGLMLGLTWHHAAPKVPLSPQPLCLEIRIPTQPQAAVPLLEKIPAAAPEPRPVAPDPPPLIDTLVESESIPTEPVRPSKKNEAPPKAPRKAKADSVRTEPISQSLPTVPPSLPVTQASVTPTPPTAAPAAATLPKPPVAETTHSRDVAPVLLALAELIERHKDYPKAARRAGFEGIVVMKVSISPTGVITGWILEQSSAHAVLDKATEKTFERLVGQKIAGAPLDGQLQVLVPVKYELRDRD